MSHWIILPILLPLLSGIGLLLGERYGWVFIRTLNIFATATLLALAVMLLISASKGDYQVYFLGHWPAPFGIVLVLDRLSALMLTLTALIALFSLLYALG
jgi:multicomponent K+:H+ antiporter subunit D